jgi:hypothetical protein
MVGRVHPGRGNPAIATRVGFDRREDIEQTHSRGGSSCVKDFARLALELG